MSRSHARSTQPDNFAELQPASELSAPNADFCKDLGRVAGGISHRLSELLGVVLCETQLLLAMGPHPREEASLRKIEQAALLAGRASRHIGRFAAAASRPDQAGVLDINDLLREAAEVSRYYWTGDEGHHNQPRDIRLELAGTALVAACPLTLHRLLVELLSRAAQLAPDGSSLRVSTRVDPSHVTVVVREAEPEAAQRPFPAFGELRSLRAAPDSDGLWLSAHQQDAEAVGGRLSAQRGPAGGLTFFLTLPRAHVHAVGPAAEPPSTRSRPAVTTGRALVVDDDLPLLQTIATALSTMGLQVATAGSGEKALELLNVQNWDLVITDLAMPGVDGQRVAEAARTLSPDVPIVLLTGWGDQLRPTEAAHYDAVLNKPVTLAVLSDTVTELLAATPFATAARAAAV